MYEEILNDMIEASKIARDIILDIYKDDFKVKIKDDDSPVTLADVNADKAIKEYLSLRYPDFGFLTEESVDDLSRLEKEYIFIIDPLDGTADFVAKNGEFTVNIALCKNHKIVAGVVMIPVKNVAYFAYEGGGSFKLDCETSIKSKIHVSNRRENLICLTSRFHQSQKEIQLIEKYGSKIAEVKKAGSSLKACLISEGAADISFRPSAGTKEWDTAAFEIIVEEAGGIVVKPNGEKMIYNRVDYRNLEGYIIANEKENIDL